MANDKDFKVKNGIQPTVYNETVGTVVSGSVGYSLATASYDSVSFSVSAQAVTPSDIEFKSDGTKMYILEGITNRVMYQYSLSTAFDITTASYDSVSFSVATQATGGYGLFFKGDGTSFYVADIDTESIYQYSLSTAWDLSTASYASKSFSISSQTTNPFGVSFKSDGTKMFVLASTTDTVYEYDLSTAWDVSTASYNSVSFSVTTQESFPTSLVFNDTGTKFFVGGNTDAFYEYNLSTSWDLSTASYSGNNLSVVSQESSAYGLRFNDDGTKGFVVGFTNDTVYQYSTAQTTASLDLSTGTVFEVTPTSDIQIGLSNPAASGTVSAATLLLSNDGSTTYNLSSAAYEAKTLSVGSQENIPSFLSFSDDGTKCYVGGYGTDGVDQYNLTTAWDVSTGSYASKTLGLGSQDTVPRGGVIGNSGSAFYMVGDTNNTVYQYNLSTAWDIGTGSYASKSFSVSSQTSQPEGITFSSDGSKMYVVSTSGTDAVFEYNLSTAWDISTASYNSVTLSVSSQDGDPRDLTFSSDGTKLYIVGDINNSVFQYNLSTAWDLSTASYASISYSVASQEAEPTGIYIGNNGQNMYICGPTSDLVYQYSIGFIPTITYDTTLQWPSGTAPTSPAVGETDVLTFTTRDGGTTYNGILAIDGAK